MLYYILKCQLKDLKDDAVSRHFIYRKYKTKIEEVMATVNDKIGPRDRIIWFKSDRYSDEDGQLTFVVGTSGNINIHGLARSVVAKMDFVETEYEISEVMINDIFALTRYSGSEMSKSLINMLDLLMLYESSRGYVPYDEKLINVLNKDSVYELCDEINVSTALHEELDRIYLGSRKKRAVGIPVHYIIKSDNRKLITKETECLISALYDAGRVTLKRYGIFNRKSYSELSRSAIECLFDTSTGGAFVFEINAMDPMGDDTRFGRGELAYIEDICELINRYGNKVQIILCTKQENHSVREAMEDFIDDATFIEIDEDHIDYEESVEYLNDLAARKGLRTDRKLVACLNEGERYYSSELETKFDRWYSGKLRTTVFPQYKDFSSVKKDERKKEAIGSAYDELQAMIGLNEVKKIIDESIDLNRAQKLFEDKGVKNMQMTRHMIFTGAPGTAKTTVARLFARIFKDNKVLSRGHLVEVGRSDLVGKYVGWTAPTVQKKFKEAIGGVLFIDEAYSLVDDRDGLYGDEAINTIVQEMENHRNEVIVIFAGYPDKMEKFLAKNPGLRSRIAFHVPFKNYNADELCAIADNIAGRSDVKFTDGAREKLRRIFAEALKDEDFGNGRYVRNIIEKAKLAQAGRLVRMDPSEVTKEDIMTLTAEDINMPAKISTVKHTIGFEVV